MRGRFQDQGGMFSLHFVLEKRIPPEPSLAQDPRTRPRGFEGVEPYVPEALLARRPTVDPARAAVKRVDFAGALLGSLRAPADGAARLQSAVSLVRWPLIADDPIWDPTVFTKNRERLQEGDVYQKFMTKLLKHREGETAPVGRALLG